jgi:glycerophosphoryl diester phosphodiesterase
MRVVAHRGNSAVAPQNTLAAFEAAWRAGADCVEMDVQLTADGRVVVIHDDTVDATTDGSGPVSSYTLDAIRALDAGAWFSPAFAGQQVPAFEEVVAFLRRRQIDLLLEFKDAWSADDVALCTEPLLTAGVGPRVVVQSFEVSTVAALRDAAPQLRRGLLLEAVPRDLDDLAEELGVVTVNPDGALLLADPTFVAHRHAAGQEVAPWTLDEPWEWQTAERLRVDAVITDCPDRLRGWLVGREP